MGADERRYRELTHAVIGAAFDVSNELGVGYLEKVYENAMFVELTRRNLKAVQQRSVQVLYRGAIVGDYLADLIVEDLVLVELKHVTGLSPAHIAQRINYLRATGLKVCLLINFGKEQVEWKRIVNEF